MPFCLMNSLFSAGWVSDTRVLSHHRQHLRLSSKPRVRILIHNTLQFKFLKIGEVFGLWEAAPVDRAAIPNHGKVGGWGQSLMSEG